MTCFSFLFSPTVRVYNLRLLLLVNIAYIAYLVTVRVEWKDPYLGNFVISVLTRVDRGSPLPFLLTGLPLILLHHTFV
jgi:hypothetical protein